LSRSRNRPRSPSWYTTRLFAFASKNGQLVTVYGPSGDPVFRGYVAGWDDYSWGLVDTQGHVVALHKASSFLIGFGQDGDLERESPAVRDALTEITSRHRDWVLAEHFSAEPPQSAAG
jgi:hypothetical protein